MKRILIFSFSFFYLILPAQRYYNDAALWFNLYLEKKISKKFAVHLNQQDRWTQNVTRFKMAYADIGVTFKLTKNIKFLADYVFAENRKKNNTFGSRDQYYVAVIFKKDVARWRFMYRNMFQLQYYEPFSTYDGFVSYYYDRSKFTLKFTATKRFEFYIAEELYMPLNNPQIKGFDRSRSFAGVFYKTTKHQQLEFYFMLQAQLQKGDWFRQHDYYPDYLLEHDFVYGIGYSIAF